jgi:hypothetical protein
MAFDLTMTPMCAAILENVGYAPLSINIKDQGYAFADMPTLEIAMYCQQQLHGQNMHGSRLKVNCAVVNG